MNEIWKSVVDYEGIYEVSNFGNVRNVNWRGCGYRNLTPAPDKDGYAVVTLCKDNRQSVKRVHRLVAIAFIDNPLDKAQVNHKDENKWNNNVGNLEWVTCEENNNYGTRNDRVSKNKLNTNCKAVLQYDKNGSLLRKWLSMCEVKRQCGFDTGPLSKCCRGVYKSAYGYVWRYAVEEEE